MKLLRDCANRSNEFPLPSFLSLSVVKGRIPQIGEKVLVKAVYNPSQSVPWNALKVQTLSNQVAASFVLPVDEVIHS